MCGFIWFAERPGCSRVHRKLLWQDQEVWDVWQQEPWRAESFAAPRCCRWQGALKDVTSHNIQICVGVCCSLGSHPALLSPKQGPGHLFHPTSSVNRLSVAFPCDWRGSTRATGDAFPKKCSGGLFLAQLFLQPVKYTTNSSS